MKRWRKNFRRINDNKITRKSDCRRRECKEEGFLMCLIVEDLPELCLKSVRKGRASESAI